MEITLIHLSDLHFKNDTKDRFRLEKLRDDLAQLPLGSKVVTLFTGDLVQSGNIEQYNVLFELLMAPLIEANHDIAVVPGNHDIQRELASKDQAMKWLADEGSSYLFNGNALQPSPYPAESISPLKNYMDVEELFGPYFERNYYGYIKQIGDLEIVGMNSTWLSHSRNPDETDRGKLRVEPYVLQHFSEQLPDKSLKVLLLHHPFDWLEEITRNAVTALATEHFDLVLFGHVHTADTTTLVRNERGASLIQSPPLRSDWSKGTNGYSVIRCDTETKASEISYRSYSDSRRTFVRGEDFGEQGICYPSKTDRKHYEQSPSLSSLAQKFLAEKHDYVDWYRRNIRAKSSYIESFIMPRVIRIVASQDDQWSEPLVSLERLFTPINRDQFVIAPADSGLSTSAFLAFKGRAEMVEKTESIPVFFDASESSINKASILTAMTQKCLVRYTTQEMQRLAEKGAITLIVDGLNLSNAERFNTFREIMRKHYPNVRVMAFVRTEKVGQAVSGADSPELSLVNDEIYWLGEMTVEQIREVIILHKKKVDGEVASRLATQAVESLSQINEPVFPSTVAVLVETLVQDQEFRPINKARLLDRYVECHLGRFELEDVREGSFTSFDKINLLSFIARRLLEQDLPGLSDVEWHELIKKYEQEFMIELPLGLLNEFEEKGLLVSEGGSITFRADYLFSYFIARQMKSDAAFAQTLIKDDGLYKHASEVIFYGQLEGTDTAAVLNELYNKTGELQESLLEQYSKEGIDLTTEWIKAADEKPEEIATVMEELRSFEGKDPDPEVADDHDNRKLANVMRRRGIARRTEVVELEARLLVTMGLYGHLIRNALHINGTEKLRHLGMLYDAAETWVGFMSASRAHICAQPVTVAGGVTFINHGALIDPKKSIADFKFNAPNSISRVLAEAVRNPQLSGALRNVLPNLSPMGALFARDALLGLPSSENRAAYLASIRMSNNKTLQMSSMRTLKHKYLGSGRDTAMREHTTGIVNDVSAFAGDSAIGGKHKLEKQRLVRDLKENVATQKRKNEENK
tara:strand:- start:156 stop:3260 length:3105 start_codon:yes stop_codon:yes gene_type:complete